MSCLIRAVLVTSMDSSSHPGHVDSCGMSIPKLNSCMLVFVVLGHQLQTSQTGLDSVPFSVVVSTNGILPSSRCPLQLFCTSHKLRCQVDGPGFAQMAAAWPKLFSVREHLLLPCLTRVPCTFVWLFHVVSP